MTEETGFSPAPMAVSLDLELSTLASAARGAQILADFQIRHGFLEEDTEGDAPVCIMSILALVGGRIDQLRRVVRGEENPGHIWAPHNTITLPETLEDADGDIVLFPWDSNRVPLVLCRPSGWATEARKEPRERKGEESKEPASESPGLQGEELTEPPPSEPEPT